MEEEPHALVERRGHVLIVTMNRPQARNALSGPMMELMRQAWDTVDGDPGIRACVLTGAGGAFCAGADLVAMTRDHPGDRQGALRLLEQSHRTAEELGMRKVADDALALMSRA